MTPRVAVVVPVHGHPALVNEALASALDPAAPDIAVVAVNDGCPHAQTRDALAGWRSAAPDRVHVLTQANRGLSAARNAGVAHALAAWPSVEAVYFLDADNRLDPAAPAVFRRTLDDHPLADWFYPPFDMFGLGRNAHALGGFDAALLAGGNPIEAGSLVRRRLFDAGLRFDEDLRAGYEDWDFWLSAAGRGYRGRPFDCGVLAYRKRPDSMLSRAHARDAELRAHLVRRHRWLFARDNLARLASREAPRLVLVEDDAAWTVTDAATRAATAIPEQVDLLLQAAARPAEIRAPAFWCLARPGAWEALADRRLLTSALWHLQRGLMEAEVATLRLQAARDGQMRSETRAKADRPVFPPAYDTAATPAETRWEHDRRKAARAAERRRLAEADLVLVEAATLTAFAFPRPRADGTGSPTTPLQRASVAETVFDLPDLPAPAGEGLETRAAALVDRIAAQAPRRDALAGYASWRAAPDIPGPAELEATIRTHTLGGPALMLPAEDDRPRIGFVLPVFQYGGVEKCAVMLAGALRGLGWSPSLFVCGDRPLTGADWMTRAFDAVHMLHRDGLPDWHGPRYLGTGMARPPDAELGIDLGAPLAAMDAVVSTGWPVIFPLLRALQDKGVVTLSWEHLVETSPHGVPYGSPFLALGHEAVLDMILTCSAGLADWLAAQGVPRDKLLALPNGPGFPADAAALAAGGSARADRLVSGRLSVGFLGRIDRQKGADRFAALAAACDDLPIDFSVTGAPVLGTADPVAFPARVALHPPAQTPAELDAAYARLDVLVLPSRDEGLPLTLLEARRAGVIPLATRVGSVPEAVADGETGLLVDPADPVPALRAALVRLLGDSALRQRLAVPDAMPDTRWPANAATLDAALRPLIASRR